MGFSIGGGVLGGAGGGFAIGDDTSKIDGSKAGKTKSGTAYTPELYTGPDAEANFAKLSPGLAEEIRNDLAATQFYDENFGEGSRGTPAHLLLAQEGITGGETRAEGITGGAQTAADALIQGSNTAADGVTLGAGTTAQGITDAGGLRSAGILEGAGTAADATIAGGNLFEQLNREGLQGFEDSMSPFASAFGQSDIDNLRGLGTDPNQQLDFLQNNPLFDALRNQSREATFNTQSGTGALGSSGTDQMLQNSFLSQGQDLIDRQFNRGLSLLSGAQNASGRIGDARLGTLRDIGATQGSAVANAGGIRGAGQTNSADALANALQGSTAVTGAGQTQSAGLIGAGQSGAGQITGSAQAGAADAIATGRESGANAIAGQAVAAANNRAAEDAARTNLIGTIFSSVLGAAIPG